MGRTKVVIFEVPSLWGAGAQTPMQASERVMSQFRKYDLRGGFWTITPLPRPCRDPQPDRVSVSLVGQDRPREEGRSVTVEVEVEAPSFDDAVEVAYARLHDATLGPWTFLVKYSGSSHALAIPVSAGEPVQESTLGLSLEEA